MTSGRMPSTGKLKIMFPKFLPDGVEQLTEPASIALAQNVEQIPLTTPLTEQPINTTYVHQGSDGTPFLLLHGFDSSVLEYRRLLPLLAAQNQTWAVDLLGFGFSDRLTGIKFNPDEIKIHLHCFWKELINRPIILVGASMGGATAIDFALSYREVVEKLVLIDSAGLTGGSPASRLMFPPLDYLATEFLKNRKIRQSISRTAYKNKQLATEDALYCGAMHLQMPNWNKALIAFTKSGGYQPFKANQLEKINQETLILWGDNDKILGTKDAHKFERAIPNSTLTWIKDSGHVPHLEQPQATAKEILDFRF